MIDPAFSKKVLSLIMGFLMEFGNAQPTVNTAAQTQPTIAEITAENLAVSTISVSCLKVTWTDKPDRDYTISCKPHDPDYAYSDNIYFHFKDEGLCYITGLREGNEYSVTIKPVLKDDEKDGYTAKSATAESKTETVEVIQEYPFEDGWTGAFAGERASGLRAMPASGAIAGSIVDPITDTGIRRDEYGDYCAALGLFYGLDNDRYLVTLQNGTQFTVKQCDSKGWADDGEGKYHNFGNGGKCIVEFIYDDYTLPSCVAYSGSWGYYNWNGLDLGANIESIKKINYGEKIEY